MTQRVRTGGVRCTAAGIALAALLSACSAGRPDAEPVPTPGVPSTQGATSTPGGPSSQRTPLSEPSVATDVPGDVEALRRQQVDWRDCDDGFSCATVDVPLDYDDPAAGTIGLAVVRLPARTPAERIGSLLLNPGGPGQSGVEYARAARRVVSARLLDRFDIVGFDPRGVGASAPVRCQSDEQLDAFLASDGSPDDPGEEERVVELARALAERCGRAGARVLPHLGTVDAARDLDVLRAVVGDERLNYFGRSYGTALGAAYAEEFPDRVGRLVLDGAIDPDASGADIDREQARGFELALRSYVEDCLTRDSCPLPRPRPAALQAVDDLLARVDREPLRGDGEREVTQGLVVVGIAAALYSRSSWPVLSQAFSQARDGDGRTFLLLADSYADRGPDGRYRSNSNDAYFAVSCLDRADRPDVGSARAAAAELSRVSPRFGAYIGWGALPCGFWPAPPTRRPQEVRATGAAPILVVGTERDPATPLIWSRALADQLESGVLLTRDGDGHLAYGRGNRCIDEAVDTCLLEGRPPADGTRC